ncbi:hypothetical protein E4U57_006142 [Claviceps arundinis]|uniref:Uncharacterized protein n=1 Tax=Claviceps arundinis TaxID=1623583 RepID=A0A9P7ST33_9HYPO|nr:hypothetical protein E4U57_006142 [Claviceps arundinis]KAG5975489.1 hypothetical protein E4U56_003689 [Claviceps arundinis]
MPATYASQFESMPGGDLSFDSMPNGGASAASSDDENAGTAQKGRARHPAFTKFDKVQGGLKCKTCDFVIKSKDLERILKHLCKCPKAQPRDKGDAMLAYQERYQRHVFGSHSATPALRAPVATRPSMLTSIPTNASTTQKGGPIKHPAFMRFDKVQAGLKCKTCEKVIRSNDLERILKHLCQCPRAQPVDKADAELAYQERYQKRPFRSAVTPAVVPVVVPAVVPAARSATLTTITPNAGAAQKGRIKHPAFNKFDKVQDGLLCKACAKVIRSNDLERILKHLCKCPRTRPGDKAAALAAYEERYQRRPLKPSALANAGCPLSASSFTRLSGLPLSAPLDAPPSDAPLSAPSSSAPLNAPPPSAPPSVPSLRKWFDSITPLEKKQIDQELAATLYHLGLPFSLCEAPMFVSLLKKLRPAYTPPSSEDLAQGLADSSR